MKQTCNIFDVSCWKAYPIVEGEVIVYLQYLNDILLQGNRNLEFFELHHIVPKSIDSNLAHETCNLIKLTGKEHFIAHQLLLKCFTDEAKSKMYYAYNIMCNKFGNTHIECPEDYEKFRKEFRQICVINNVRKNNPMYGRHHTEETKKQYSLQRKGKLAGDNNPMYGVDRRGEKNPNYGNVRSAESRELTGKNSRGRIWINNGKENKFIKPKDLHEYESKGFIYKGCLINGKNR